MQPPQASKGVFIALNIRLMERGPEFEGDDEGRQGRMGPQQQQCAQPGHWSNPLPRHEWIGLVMTHVAQHTDSLLQPKDLEVASRWRPRVGFQSPMLHCSSPQGCSLTPVICLASL